MTQEQWADIRPIPLDSATTRGSLRVQRRRTARLAATNRRLVPMYEGQPTPPPLLGPTVDAAKLWSGGAATAVVTALIAVVGILIARGVLDIFILAPEREGCLGCRIGRLVCDLRRARGSGSNRADAPAAADDAAAQAVLRVDHASRSGRRRRLAVHDGRGAGEPGRDSERSTS